MAENIRSIIEYKYILFQKNQKKSEKFRQSWQYNTIVCILDFVNWSRKNYSEFLAWLTGSRKKINACSHMMYTVIFVLKMYRFKVVLVIYESQN